MPMHLLQVQPAPNTPLNAAQHQPLLPTAPPSEQFSAFFSRHCDVVAAEITTQPEITADDSEEDLVGVNDFEDQEPEQEPLIQAEEMTPQNNAPQTTTEHSIDGAPFESLMSGTTTPGYTLGRQVTAQGETQVDGSLTEQEPETPDMTTKFTARGPAPDGFSGLAETLKADTNRRHHQTLNLPLEIEGTDLPVTAQIKTQIGGPRKDAASIPLVDEKLMQMTNVGTPRVVRDHAIALEVPTSPEMKEVAPVRSMQQLTFQRSKAGPTDAPSQNRAPDMALKTDAPVPPDQSDQSNPDVPVRNDASRPETQIYRAPLSEPSKQATLVSAIPETIRPKNISVDSTRNTITSVADSQFNRLKPAQAPLVNSTPVRATREVSIVSVEDDAELVLVSDAAKDPHHDGALRLDSSLNQTVRAQGETPAMQNQTARWVSSQVADAVAKRPDGPVEIALNPEELGRVRMILSPSDTGVTVLISTERPETHDLMRRHIDLLADEFRRLGYEDIGFEFTGGGAESSTNSEENEQTPKASLLDTSGRQIPEPIQRLASTGLDLRL